MKQILHSGFWLGLIGLLCLPLAGRHFAKPPEMQAAGNRLARPARGTEPDVLPSFDRQLVHLVWFRLDPALTPQQQEQFLDELRTLDEIDEVRGLEVGRFHDLGDERALSDLDIVMRMGFGSEDDYHAYQAHPVHRKLKQGVGKYLAGTPVTYDYWTE